MIPFSTTTGYAIQALSLLAKNGSKLLLVKDIADQTGIPKPYLSRILYSLGQAGLITTKRGYRGGVTLAKNPAEISLLDLAEALKDSSWRERCILGFATCGDEKPCPLHDFWGEEREEIIKRLAQMSLADVANSKEMRVDYCSRPVDTATGGSDGGES